MKKYLFFTAILITIYFLANVYNDADYDLWHRLAAGKLFFSQGHVQYTDIFAYTPTKKLWIDHEWGSGVVFYFIAEKFGLVGLGVLKIILMFLTFLPVYLINRMRTEKSDKYRILFYLVFLYALMWGFLYTIRSQCFTYVFFAWFLYLIELVKSGKRKILWAFPPMAVIWANLHGGFLAGLGVLLLAGFPLTAITSGLATIINPYGFKYWEYLVEALTMKRIFITEWQPLDLSGPLIFALGFKIFLVISVIGLVHIAVKKREGIRWHELLILSVTLYLSLKHTRHNVFFVIASAAYMGEYFFAAISRIAKFMPQKFLSGTDFLKDVLIYVIIVLVGILTVWLVPFKVEVSENNYPVKSVDFIKKNNLSGNLLVLFNWGGYALWNLYPQCKIAIDGRYEEVYPDDVVYESARFHYLGKDWKEFMFNYKTDLILIDKSYPVYSELLSLDDWKIVYSDKVSGVFMPAIKAKGRQWVAPDETIVIQASVLDSKIGDQADK